MIPMNLVEIPAEFKQWIWLLAPRPCNLVTTVSTDGRVNVATMYSSQIISYQFTPRSPLASNLVSFSVHRSRHTYECVNETGEFVVNTPGLEIIEAVEKAGLTRPKARNEALSLGLTPVESQKVEPPRLAECLAHLECKVTEVQRQGDYHLVIGRVIAASARESVVEKAARRTDASWGPAGTLTENAGYAKEYDSYLLRGEWAVQAYLVSLRFYDKACYDSALRRLLGSQSGLDTRGASQPRRVRGSSTT